MAFEHWKKNIQTNEWQLLTISLWPFLKLTSNVSKHHHVLSINRRIVVKLLDGLLTLPSTVLVKITGNDSKQCGTLWCILELLILKSKGCHNITPWLRFCCLFNRHVTIALSMFYCFTLMWCTLSLCLGALGRQYKQCLVAKAW